MNTQNNRVVTELKNTDSETELKNIAAANFARWNEFLQCGNPKQVADLYTDDATFLPTVSGDFKKGKHGAEEYFRHFVAKTPKGEITESVIQKIDDRCYLHSGKYNFQVGPQDDRKILHARFTFLWQLNMEGIWQIAHHHSSLNPEK